MDKYLSQISRITEREAEIRDDFFIGFLNFIPNYIRPNHITAIRFILLWLLFFSKLITWNQAFLIVIICSLSDLVDGVLARKRNQITSFGVVFDHISDLLFAFGVLWFLFHRGAVGFNMIIHIILPSSFLFIYAIWNLLVPNIKRMEPNIFGRISFTLYAFGFSFIFLSQIIGIVFINNLAVLLIVLGVVLSWLAQFFYVAFLYNETRKVNKGN